MVQLPAKANDDTVMGRFAYNAERLMCYMRIIMSDHEGRIAEVGDQVAAELDAEAEYGLQILPTLWQHVVAENGWSVPLRRPMALVVQAFDKRLIQDGWAEWNVNVHERPGGIVRYTVAEVGTFDLIPLGADMTRVVFGPSPNYASVPKDMKWRVQLAFVLMNAWLNDDYHSLREQGQLIKVIDDGVARERGIHRIEQHVEQPGPSGSVASASIASNDRKGNAQARRKDSGHYAYSEAKRREIVADYHQARAEGKVQNMDSWAHSNYGICGKTLRNYLKEFEAES